MAERLIPGLVMARDLARPGAWIPLIRAGTALTPEVIARVRRLGLEEEALDCVDRSARPGAANLGFDPEEDGPAPPPRLAGAATVPSRPPGSPPRFLQDHEIEILHEALQGHCLPDVVRQLVRGVVRRVDAYGAIPDYRLTGVHMLRHPLNVLTLSTVVGKALGYEPEALFSLATGALLHEVEPAGLAANAGLSRLATAAKVHDTIRAYSWWYRGTGSLDAPAGNALPHPAQVLAVADVYDTMLSDRPDTTRMPPGIAYTTLKAMAGRRLEARTVEAFSRNVVPYPVGTTVVLSDRRRGKVASVPADQPLKPVVDVDGEMVDLAATRGLEIADVHVVRREERVTICLPVRIRLDDGDLAWGMLVDVSEHGMCVEIDGSVPAATRVEIEFSAPYRASLLTRAVVCWSRETAQETTRIGLYVPRGGLRKAARIFADWAS